MKFIIEGGKKLSGTIQISGNKNSVFPTFAAALLTDEEVVLENVPKIRDTEVLIEILKKIGADVKKDNSSISITASKLMSELPDDLMIKLRGSIVLVGAILARERRVTFHHPGGDVIGRRSISSHLDGFRALGVKVKKDDLNFHLEYTHHKDSQNTHIFLVERSVTATENLILASVLGKGEVVLRNAASEPHVVDLCYMLTLMGAQINGIGTDTLTINSVPKLHGTRFKLGADVLEAGTYAVAAAITNGKIKIEGIEDTDLEPILVWLKRFGVEADLTDSTITFYSKKLRAISDFPGIFINQWPGFPTDLMSAMIVLASQAEGMTLCHDWMYESRMFFVDKLISMGANIIIADPHRVLVYGPTKLFGRELESPDIRAGMALVLAALAAKGISIINKAELIERGYEDVVGKLKMLGANIERQD